MNNLVSTDCTTSTVPPIDTNCTIQDYKDPPQIINVQAYDAN